MKSPLRENDQNNEYNFLEKSELKRNYSAYQKKNKHWKYTKKFDVGEIHLL